MILNWAVRYELTICTCHQYTILKLDCLPMMWTDTDERSYSFIQRKDNYGLKYPSADVIKICKRAEAEVRILQVRVDIFKTAACSTIVNRCLREFVNSSVFSNLTYIIGQEAIMNHRMYLIKAILFKYIDIRLKHVGREHIQINKKIVWIS